MNWLFYSNLNLNVMRLQYVGMCLVIPQVLKATPLLRGTIFSHWIFLFVLGETTWNWFCFCSQCAHYLSIVLTISPTKCAKHARGWEVTMKKHVFSSPLPFLISSPGVSMATKSLSGGSLSADALTSIKSLSLCLSLRIYGTSFTYVWQTQHYLHAISLKSD